MTAPRAQAQQTWPAFYAAEVAPIETRIRAICERADAEGRDFTDQELVAMEGLRAERRALLDGDDDAASRPTAADLRADLEFDVGYEDVGPRTRAADLREQLDSALEEERRASERAAHVQRSRDSFEVDEAQRARHRDARAASSWRAITAVARHEAGHVVAGILTEARGGPRLLGARFLYGSAFGGETAFDGVIPPLVSAAGAAASRVLGFTDHLARLSAGDRANLERAGVDSMQRQQQLVEHAVALLSRHIDAVTRIADVLFRDGVIAADTARAIVAGKYPRPTPAGGPSEVSLQPIPWGRPAPSWSEAAW